MKVTIVGSREDAWVGVQKSNLDTVLRHIVNNLKLGNILESGTISCNELSLITSITAPMRCQVFDTKDLVIVTGRSPAGGVDIKAEKLAEEHRVKTEIYPPAIFRWMDKRYGSSGVCGTCRFCEKDALVAKNHYCGIEAPPKKPYLYLHECHLGLYDFKQALIGFRSRNIQMIRATPLPPDGVLECIVPKGTTHGGSLWTMEQAQKVGREVHLIEVE